MRNIAKQAGVDLLTPNDLRLTYLTELERLATRRPDDGQARRITGARDAVRSVPGARIRRSSRRGVNHTALQATETALPEVPALARGQPAPLGHQHHSDSYGADLPCS